MTFKPTLEQTAIIDQYRGGAQLVVEAGAGTGKSSTLRLLGEAEPSRRGLYLAFNKAIAVDAGRTFPRNITCRTAHSLAYQAVAKPYAHRLKAPRLRARDVADILAELNPAAFDLGLDVLHRNGLARVAAATVTRYQQSAEDRPLPGHVPDLPGLRPDEQGTVVQAAVMLASSIWSDLNDRDGRCRYTHDTYLKQWALTRPKLHVDTVMLDEAQDTNPVLSALVEAQDHAQLVAVGDQQQAIYGWRGATDAMAAWSHWVRLQLSQSFRFGPELAEFANLWLELLGASLRLSGHGPYDTEVGYVAEADAILTRGNVGALVSANHERDNGRQVAIVGGTKEIKALAFAARDLQDGRPTDHPELLGFDDWAAVQEYCEEDADGSDLATFVRLIDRFGYRWVLGVADDFATEDGAEVVVSTAHKAKGREWNRVQIGSDFPQPGDIKRDGTPVIITREDAMLAYVAVTRAREQLDPGGLAWIEHTRPDLDSPTAVAA